MLNRALLEKRGYGAMGLALSVPAAWTLAAESGIPSETLRRAGDRRLARRRGVGGGPVSNNREYPGQAVVWLKIT